MLNLVIGAGILVTILTGIPVALQMRNHPKGLVVCFFTEMWERFSYYGMRGLLLYYLTKQFLFTDTHASQQYASYATLIYLVPMIGGLIADRFLGTRRAVIFGGLLLVFGHLGMAFEGQPNHQTLIYQGQTYEYALSSGKAATLPKLKVGDAFYEVTRTPDGGRAIAGLPQGAPLPAVLAPSSFTEGVKKVTPWAEKAFYLSISLIIMGVGFLKPNISTIVGQLYKDRDPRRDSGFQLYYFGINLGSFWAAVICGYLGETVGWWAGFGAAGIGMAAGLIGFLIGKPWLMGKGEAPDAAGLKTKIASFITKEHLIYLGGLLGIPVVYFLVQRNDIVFLVLAAATVSMLGYIVYNMVKRFTRVENFRIALALILSVSSIVFFALEELAGSALSLFADRNVNLNLSEAASTFTLFGQTFLVASREQLAAMTMLPANYVWIDIGLTAAQTQTINTGFILILAPIFAALFTFLGRRNADPDPVKKFSVAIAATGIGFLILVWASPFHNALFQLPLIFLVLNYLFTTVGEMALSPVGLSQQTKLSPPLIASTMMALWFTGLSWAQFVGGIITARAAVLTVGGEVVDPAEALHKSLTVFGIIGWTAVAVGIGMFLLSFAIKGWAGGANDTGLEESH